jgi:hypothetical protein
MRIFANHFLCKCLNLQIVFYVNTNICKLQFTKKSIYTEGSPFLLKN